MLVYVVQFGPAALALGSLLVASLILNRRGSARWLRFRTWLKSGPQGERNLLGAGYYVAFGLLLAFGDFLARRLGEKPAPGSLGLFWIFWGVSMAILMPIVAAFFKRPKEPEDWLLWDKEEAKNE